MAYAYSNNGKSFRAVEEDWPRNDGEVLFLEPPSHDHLVAAFPFVLEIVKERKWDEIKAERDRRRFDGGVNVDSHWFLTTATATGEYSALVLMSAGATETTVLRPAWRTMDGSLVDMTPKLAKAILLAGFVAVAAIDDAAQAHKAAMEASADPSGYDFSTDWPKIYGE